MSFDRITRAIAATCAISVLAACGGGGGSVSGKAPVSIATTTPTAPTGATGQATFRIDTGATATSSNARSSQYISPSTASATITLQGQQKPIATITISPASPGCSPSATGTQCSVTLTVPAGQQQFIVATLDANGNTLSTAPVTFTIVQNTTNTIPIVLNGVVATAKVVLATTSVQAGTATQIPVTVAAYDAAGNIIVGPGTYSTPITLTDSDTTGVTTLSATQITGPGSSNVMLTYNGQSIAAATITPSNGNVAGSSATFSPGGYTFATFSVTGLAANVPGFGFATGADGNLWTSSQNTIGWTNLTGTSMQFYGTANGLPNSQYNVLAAGSDGNMWYGSEDGYLGSITTGGSVTPIVSIVTPNGCVSHSNTSIARRPEGIRVPQGGPTPTPGPGALAACGSIEAITLGPDGNIWFVDSSGFVGTVSTSHTAIEYDITALPGWPSGAASWPYAMTFGNDGKLYFADKRGYIGQLTIAGSVPTSVVALNLDECDGLSIAVGADNNVYAGDDCEQLQIVPAGTGFAATSLQAFDVSAILGSDIESLQATPGGIFASGYRSSEPIVRISNFAVLPAQAQPLYNQIPLDSAPAWEHMVIGPDHNLYVNGILAPQDEIGKIIYGGSTVGAQSAKRLPRAVPGLRSAAKG